MTDQRDVTLKCPHCGEMFHAQFSPYMKEKTTACPSCGKEIPIEASITTPAPAPTEPIPAVSPKNERTWLDRNGVLVAGWVCFLVGVCFALISVTTLFVFIPLFACALVFGVVAVIQKRLFHGLALIMAAAVVGTGVVNVAFEKEFGKELRQATKELEQSTKQMEQMFKR